MFLILLMLIMAVGAWMFGVIFGPAVVADPMNSVLGKVLLGALFFGGGMFCVAAGLWAVWEFILAYLDKKWYKRVLKTYYNLKP